MSGKGPILYPNVTSVPSQSTGNVRSDRGGPRGEGVPGEFDKVFEQTLNPERSLDLNQVREPLKFSAHASQRLRDRKIALDSNMMSKISAAVDQAEAKGIDDTLVLTPDAALIVNVKNRTVITAMDRGSMTGNVFTNIDGAVIV